MIDKRRRRRTIGVRIFIFFMRSSIASNVLGFVLVVSSVFGATLPVLAAPGAPTNLTIVGGKYTNDTTPTFTWTPGSGATWYEFLVDDGNWIGISNVSSYTLWPLADGWHGFYLRAHDSASGVSTSTKFVFEVDTQGPSIAAVTPSSASLNVAQTYSVTPTGESGTKWCWLYVDGNNTGAMTASSNGKTFSRSYTFTSTGNHTLYARCADGDNNYSVGTSRTLSISGTSTSSLAHGTVIRTSTSSAVYYYGNDGKKHLFPTENVYFSWFASYSSVTTISSSLMNALPVGENVTYRPGTVLVKFTSSSTVYAVSQGAVLHPIANASVAQSIYGTNWASYIVTVPTTLMTDYVFGSTITSSSQYNKASVYASVSSIESNF